MTSVLYTIGYEGVGLLDVLDALEGANVGLLIDVRAVAVSRRAGFSKTAFAAALQGRGINYRHLRDLGDPKPGREAARAGLYARFQAIYGAHLETTVAQIALGEAERLATNAVACLLCYESVPTYCHRTIVAAAIAERTGVPVLHLAAGKGSDGVQGECAGADAYPGQGRPTAK